MKKYFLLLLIALLFSCNPFIESDNNSEETEEEVVEDEVPDNTPVGTIEYDGENASTSYISGKIIDKNDAPISDITIEFGIFDQDNNTVVDTLTLRSDSNGDYNITGLPDLTALDNIPPECISFAAYDENDFNKYEGINFHPYMELGTDTYTNLSDMNIRMLEVNENTVLKGTIEFVDGSHPVATQLFIDLSYGANDSNQSLYLSLPDMSGSDFTDERTGSFYDSETGEYQILKSICGGFSPMVFMLIILPIIQNMPAGMNLLL